MTIRRVPIRRRAVAQTLDTNTESGAAGYLVGFWHEPGASTRSYWESIAYTHGERIRAKVLEACPGTRPGFDYATGRYPPLPLLDGPPPSETLWARDYLDVDGVRFWYVAGVEGLRFVRCQAERLRELGELDGQEWQRYLAWKRSGFEPRYVLDEHPEGEPVELWHMCW